jgi:hypothetical protein
MLREVFLKLFQAILFWSMPGARDKEANTAKNFFKALPLVSVYPGNTFALSNAP